MRDEPRFVWHEETRFKNLSSEDETEQAGIASFGRAVAAIVLSVAPVPQASLDNRDPGSLRNSLLTGDSPFVTLLDLLALSWGAGIPVVHLRVFPWTQKRMAAMTVRVGASDCVLLAKDASYPPWTAFHLAHELAHIALGHVGRDQAVVDLDVEGAPVVDDEEERAADRWALELLTGRPELRVVTDGGASAAELARVALESSAELGIEPGTLALSFGHSTRQWAIANASLQRIYPTASPMWRLVNRVAMGELELEELVSDAADFLAEVLEFQDVG